MIATVAKLRHWENLKIEDDSCLSRPRDGAQHPCFFLDRPNTQKDCTSRFWREREHSLSRRSWLLESPWYACRNFFFFFARRRSGSPCCDATHCDRAYPMMASELDASIGNVTNCQFFLLLFNGKRRTNSSSQPSSQALASSAGRSWPPTDKPRPRRSTSARKPRPPVSVPQAAPL